MIKLHKYFFELSDYDINPDRKGKTQRSRKGKIFTDYTSNEYKTFKIKIDNLPRQEHLNLLYIISLIFPNSGGVGQNISFVNPLGEEYTVTIPVGGYDYNLKNVEEELWEWDITLEEVI